MQPTHFYISITTAMGLCLSILFGSANGHAARNCGDYAELQSCTTATIDAQENACVWCGEQVKGKSGVRKSKRCWNAATVVRDGMLNSCQTHEGWKWKQGQTDSWFNNPKSEALKVLHTAPSCIENGGHYCRDAVPSIDGRGRILGDNYQCWDPAHIRRFNLENQCLHPDGWYSGMDIFRDTSTQLDCKWETENSHDVPFSMLKCKDPASPANDWDQITNLNTQLLRYFGSSDEPMEAQLLIDAPMNYITRVNTRTNKVVLEYITFDVGDRRMKSNRTVAVVIRGVGTFFEPFEGQQPPPRILIESQKGQFANPINDAGEVQGEPFDHFLEFYPDDDSNEAQLEFSAIKPPPKDPRNPCNKWHGDRDLEITYNLNLPRFTRSARIEKGPVDRSGKWTTRSVGVQRAPPLSVLNAGWATMGLAKSWDVPTGAPSAKDYQLSIRDAMRIWWSEQLPDSSGISRVLGAGLVKEILNADNPVHKKKCKMPKRYGDEAYEKLCLKVIRIVERPEENEQGYVIDDKLKAGPTGFRWQYPQASEEEAQTVILRLAFAKTSLEIKEEGEFEYYLERMSHREPDGRLTGFDNHEPLEVYYLIKDYFSEHKSSDCVQRLKKLCPVSAKEVCRQECTNGTEYNAGCYQRCEEAKLPSCDKPETVSRIKKECRARARGELGEDQPSFIKWWKEREAYEKEPTSVNRNNGTYFKFWGLHSS